MNPQPQHETEEITVEEVLDVAYALLNAPIEEHEYELPSGKMADRFSITRESVTFGAMEVFGHGTTPYGDHPEQHKEYLNSPDATKTEGKVDYATDDGTLSLPKVIYFEQQVEFEDPIVTDDPSVAVDRLAEELSAIMDHAVVVNTPLGLSEGAANESAGSE